MQMTDTKKVLDDPLFLMDSSLSKSYYHGNETQKLKNKSFSLVSDFGNGDAAPLRERGADGESGNKTALSMIINANSNFSSFAENPLRKSDSAESRGETKSCTVSELRRDMSLTRSGTSVAPLSPTSLPYVAHVHFADCGVKAVCDCSTSGNADECLCRTGISSTVSQECDTACTSCKEKETPTAPEDAEASRDSGEAPAEEWTAKQRQHCVWSYATEGFADTESRRLAISRRQVAHMRPAAHKSALDSILRRYGSRMTAGGGDRL